MVLSRKGRERALIGKAIRMPPGPSASAGARRRAGSQRLGARCLPESRRRNSEAYAWPDPAPPISPGTAGVLAGIADDGARPRPVIPELPDRPRPGSPPASHPADPASANLQSRIRALRRRAAPPGYPGTPGSPPSRKPAHPASRKSRNCESRNPGSGRRAGAPPRPVLPEFPDRPRPGRPPVRVSGCSLPGFRRQARRGEPGGLTR